MAVLESILTGLAASGLYDLTKGTAAAAYNVVRQSRSDLIQRAEDAASAGDDAALREALAGALEVAAATGRVEIDGTLISALRNATFDHQHGRISIGGSQISAPILITGGSVGATGETIVGGNTVLRSAGTSINVGAGASIRITGGASIKQN